MNLVPIEKQSKKMRREFHEKQRGSWNGVCPVTRIAPNKKGYDRNRARQECRRTAEAE